MYAGYLKATFDYVVAAILVIATSPLWVLVVIIMRFEGSGPVIFKQERSGRNGDGFEILKFRTMLDIRDQEGNLLPDFERTYWLGNILRMTSLDELPQLINVLRGEMSLIGPRPLLPEYESLYNDKHRKRLSVKPGISGWAQVNGRNATTWKNRLDQDIYYIENLSFSIDLRILLLTLLKVLTARDINANAYSTMAKFSGYQ